MQTNKVWTTHQCHQVGIWRHFKSIKPRIIPASLHGCGSLWSQNPAWGAEAHGKGLTASQGTWELEWWWPGTQISWKMAPRKSPYRRFSRNGLRHLGRGEVQAGSHGPSCLLPEVPSTHRASPEPTSKFKELMSRFQWCLNGFHLHKHLHICRICKATVVKC